MMMICCAQVVTDTAVLGPLYVAAFFAFGTAVIDRGDYNVGQSQRVAVLLLLEN